MVPLVTLIILLQQESIRFMQERVGKMALYFKYKFRSMKGVPPVNDPLLSDDEVQDHFFGKFIRKYRIDEFQFINVFWDK